MYSMRRYDVKYSGTSPLQIAYAGEADETITLRICNSEEYIDEGGWDDRN